MPKSPKSPLARTQTKRDALGFTADERYWLGKLVSETGEFGQVAGNAQCFGLDTPDAGGTARERIADELGDVLAALRLGARAGLVSRDRVERRAAAKERKLLDPNQRDNLGRRLAPPVPDCDTGTDFVLAPPSAEPNPQAAQTAAQTAAPAPPAGVDSDDFDLSPEVRERIHSLTKGGKISADLVLRRALKIEARTTVPQDGTIGYQDPATGFILPEGFAIERTTRGTTHRATATQGGFRDAHGTWYENLNQLNRSLGIPRLENAWNEWFFLEESGVLRRLNSARPMTAPRNRRPGRRPDLIQSAEPI